MAGITGGHPTGCVLWLPLWPCGHRTTFCGCLTVSKPLQCLQWSLSAGPRWADDSGFDVSDILRKFFQSYQCPAALWLTPSNLPRDSPLWLEALAPAYRGEGAKRNQAAQHPQRVLFGFPELGRLSLHNNPDFLDSKILFAPKQSSDTGCGRCSLSPCSASSILSL